jgi:hypothetical protein
VRASRLVPRDSRCFTTFTTCRLWKAI